MRTPPAIRFEPLDLDGLATVTGRIVLLTDAPLPQGPAARRIERLTRGALSRALAGEAYGALKPGEALEMAYPSGLAADALRLIKLPRKAEPGQVRRAGGAIGKDLSPKGTLILAEANPHAAELAFGLGLRAYSFDVHRQASAPKGPAPGPVILAATRPEAVAAASAPLAALAEGVYFTRDLVNEPANVLTTSDFAARLAAMQELGLEVEILEEDQLRRLGMRALLGVGQGSESPSKVVILRWMGAGDDRAPLALVGKGVCFDTGGISLKPALGMEEMTMDMGGAATVAGVMRSLALRKARANVVGLVGLVENMPDGRAQRPGDVVRSMKGDTIEVINTDAEGRLVLADVLWYAQEHVKPCAMIDLATLTGAIVVALGTENTGVFSNDDAFCLRFLQAASAEGEGAWRMPMGQAYDDRLKSRVADMVNSCGRDGGAITAAQFLRRFVREDMPWIHLDIAGTCSLKTDGPLGPKGATGWGVRSLNRLISQHYEAS